MTHQSSALGYILSSVLTDRFLGLLVAPSPFTHKAITGSRAICNDPRQTLLSKRLGASRSPSVCLTRRCPRQSFDMKILQFVAELQAIVVTETAIKTEFVTSVSENPKTMTGLRVTAPLKGQRYPSKLNFCYYPARMTCKSQ
jgi:hypothetical protein